MNYNHQPQIMTLYNNSSTIIDPIPMKINNIVEKHQPFIISSMEPMTNIFYNDGMPQSSSIANYGLDNLQESRNQSSYNLLDNDHMKYYIKDCDSISPSPLKQTTIHRQKFSLEEDTKLKKLIELYGAKKWDKIATFMPGRTGRQCRDRFTNYLDSSLTNGPWTNEEDDLLEQKVFEFGLHWNLIAKFFKGRSTNNIKNRWYTYICKQKKYEIPKISSKNVIKSSRKCNSKLSNAGVGKNIQSTQLCEDNYYYNNYSTTFINPILTSNGNNRFIEPSKNILDQNQNIENLPNTINIEKKTLFPPICPPNNILNFDSNQWIISFINQ